MSNREIMDAYLSVGGIPEYLKWINQETSVFLSLCKNSFTAGSFFSHEYKRIFISSLARNKNQATKSIWYTIEMIEFTPSAK